MKAALHTDQRPQPACPAADPDLPAAAQMHALLRRRIVTGDLRPGMRLSEQDIADQYDLSRQPVREAFIRLAAEGLLEVRPQRGTFVTRINMDWVLDTRFIREATEADIAAYARTGEPLECAGAFTLEAIGGWFIDRIEGDPSSVIGLSLPVLRRALYSFDLSVSSFWQPR